MIRLCLRKTERIESSMNIYLAWGMAAAIGFIVAFLLGYVIIPWLHKLSFGQTILDIGPKWHEKKQGTPIMGGLMFMTALVVACAVVIITDRILGGDIVAGDAVNTSATKVKFYGGILMAFAFALIGFADDFIKAVKKRNLGLTVAQKTIAQLAVSIVYLGTLYGVGATYMFIPFIGMVDLKIFFWFFGIFVIYCVTNAVNFTDGVDGLCASVTVSAAVGLLVVAYLRNNLGVSMLCAALAGSCAGYLIWNWNPSKVMMGDTGSMFLGGMIVAAAYAVDCPLIIVPVGIIYVVEFASDIIQISYFKATHGKRIFKMAPIHHHFEMCGWKEKKIVKIFTLVNVIGSIAGILLVYFGNIK